MHMILENVNFQIIFFLSFSNIWLELIPMCTHNINEFFTISIFKQILNHLHLFKEMSM